MLMSGENLKINKQYRHFKGMREKIDWHICMKGLLIAKIFTDIGIYNIANKIIDFTDSIAIKYIDEEKDK